MHAIAGLISLGAVAGLTSVLLVLLLGQSRIFFAMSRDGLLPPAFGKFIRDFARPTFRPRLPASAWRSPRHFLPIEDLGEMTNIGTLFAFVLVCIGVWIMRNIEPELHRPFRTPLVPLVPILGVFFCLYLMASLMFITWVRLFVWLAIGLIIYFAYGRFHSRVQSNVVEQVRMSGG